jgi:polysaccharide biosynthesis/export protein
MTNYVARLVHTNGYTVLAAVAAGWLAVSCGVPSLHASVLSEYRLGPGDLVEITAAGTPELQRKAVIEPNGDVALPLIGRTKAAGMTISALQSRLRELLPSQVLRRRTDDGREYPIIVSSEEIMVSIAEYRPIYVNGDVGKPGEHTFRPGMTVRQALALAGGYDVMRFRAKDPFLESADLQSEYSSLWTEFAKEQIHILRLGAELADRTELDLSKTTQTPVPPAVVAEIKRMALSQLSARNANYNNHRRHLLDGIAQEDSRISSLNGQLAAEQESADADAAEFKRTKQNFEKGIAPITRLAEARRLYLSSGAQVMHGKAMIAQVERERQQLILQLAALEERRRIDLLAELDTAQVKLAMLRFRLQSVGEKLVYAGVVRTQLVRGKGRAPDLILFRRGQDAEQERRFVVEEETELLPGDVVEVSVRSEGLPAEPRGEAVGVLGSSGGSERVQ